MSQCHCERRCYSKNGCLTDRDTGMRNYRGSSKKIIIPATGNLFKNGLIIDLMFEGLEESLIMMTEGQQRSEAPQRGV